MSGTLIDPEMEAFPDRHRWTVEACYRLMDLGFINGRFEVIDGEVISKVGQKPLHAACLMCLLHALVALFGADHIRMQSPIELPGEDGIYTEPEPDAAVTTGAIVSYLTRHPQPQELALVVEVSDTSLRTDTIVKSRLYARVGIQEYWIVDMTTRSLHVYRNPQGDSYSLVTVLSEAETVTPLASPNRSIAVSSLFPPEPLA